MILAIAIYFVIKTRQVSGTISVLFFLKNTVVDVHLGHVGHEIKLFYPVRFAFSFVRIEFN